ncbi:unnamed protein product [Toxocara canis]|uniref:COMM domain-containing protein n=1 Tax=Toxocara canis TaxID=6265 RepID=A0A183U2V1_TOXCA|nr:unnamed protein product [Toxocara canis]
MSDSRGRPLPRQLLRVQRSEPEDGVLRTELRFVVYQQKSELEEEGSAEANTVIQALEALLKKFSEMNDDPSKNKSSFVKVIELNLIQNYLVYFR